MTKLGNFVEAAGIPKHTRLGGDGDGGQANVPNACCQLHALPLLLSLSLSQSLPLSLSFIIGHSRHPHYALNNYSNAIQTITELVQNNNR